jgi:tetratricopeptide (TPR) repeat protein
LKGARTMYQQAGDLSKQIGDQSGVAYALFSLGDVSTAEGDLNAAREHYNESIKLRTQMGEKGNVAETQMVLALILIEEGRDGEAENTLIQVREEFHKEGLADDEILSDILLARVFLTQGKVADAEVQTSAAHNLSASSQDFSVRLRAAIVGAQVQAAAGRTEDAVRALQETIANARKFGYAGYLLEAQLALGEVQAASGKATAGLSLLRDVHTQAELKGFHLIANKAGRAYAKSATAQMK